MTSKVETRDHPKSRVPRPRRKRSERESTSVPDPLHCRVVFPARSQLQFLDRSFLLRICHFALTTTACLPARACLGCGCAASLDAALAPALSSRAPLRLPSRLPSLLPLRSTSTIAPTLAHTRFLRQLADTDTANTNARHGIVFQPGFGCGPRLITRSFGLAT